MLSSCVSSKLVQLSCLVLVPMENRTFIFFFFSFSLYWLSWAKSRACWTTKWGEWWKYCTVLFLFLFIWNWLIAKQSGVSLKTWIPLRTEHSAAFHGRAGPAGRCPKEVCFKPLHHQPLQSHSENCIRQETAQWLITPPWTQLVIPT